MFSKSAPFIQEEKGTYLSSSVFFTALPIILFLAFTLGAVSFFMSQKPSAEATKRHAKLPVAGDRLITNSQLKIAAGLPLSVYAAGPTKPLAAVHVRESGNWVRIPALKVNVPVQEASSMKDEDVIKTLAAGVAMYPNGIQPGENGNVFIAGHSTGEPWKGPYRFAFLNINKLKTGDTVIVDYKNTRYTYVVTGTRVINPKDTQFIESHGKSPTLSLMACWPLWTTQNRIIIESKLIAINPLVVTP